MRKGGTTESSDLEKELEKELSLRNFTPLICVVLFAVLVEYAKNSKDFIILLEAAFVILSFGTLFFFWTSRRAGTKIRCITLSTVGTISIIIIVLTAYSIATVPRGGIKHSVDLVPNDMELILEKIGNTPLGVRYFGKGEQVLFEVDYPVAYVRIFYSIDAHILTQKNYSLSGTMVDNLILYPNGINHTSSSPVLTYSLPSISHNGTSSFFHSHMVINYGSGELRRELRLDNGYTVALMPFLELYGSDYGESINITVGDFVLDSWIGVSIDDMQVTSSLQDLLMIFVAGLLAGIFVPYRFLEKREQ